MKKKNHTQRHKKDKWEETLRQAVMERLKDFLEKPTEMEREIYPAETGEAKNGYDARKGLRTMFGAIRDLMIPRTREGGYDPSFLEPHQRPMGLDTMVLQMDAPGMSTRDIARWIENTYGTLFSPTSVSRLTHLVVKEVRTWQKRRLPSHDRFIYLDATFIPLRRIPCQKEAIDIVLGVDDEGYREILGFYIFPSEGARNWPSVLEDLQARGVETVDLFISDLLSGIEDAIHRVFPDARWQAGVLHAVRRVMTQVRHQDRAAVAHDRPFYRARNREEAEPELDTFTET